MKNKNTKLHRALVKAYSDMYQNLDFMKSSAKALANGDFKKDSELADIISDINYYYHQYCASKTLIEVLSDEIDKEAEADDE